MVSLPHQPDRAKTEHRRTATAALTAFGAEPPTPAAPPAPSIFEIIAAARRADRLEHGAVCAMRVIATVIPKLSHVQLTSILLGGDAFGAAWHQAARRCLRGERSAAS